MIIYFVVVDCFVPPLALLELRRNDRLLLIFLVVLTERSEWTRFAFGFACQTMITSKEYQGMMSYVGILFWYRIINDF